MAKERKSTVKKLSEQGYCVHSFSVLTNSVNAMASEEIIKVSTKSDGNRFVFKTDRNMKTEELLSIRDLFKLIKKHQAIIDKAQFAIELLLSNEYDDEDDAGYTINIVKKSVVPNQISSLEEKIDRDMDLIRDDIKDVSRTLDNQFDSLKEDLREAQSDIRRLEREC